MRALKGILLTGTAIMALVACSSDKGPGEIGSLEDIVVRNRGEKVAVPPPGAEPVKQVMIDPAATEGDTAAPSASDMIAAEDTGAQKVVEDTAAAAQEAQEKSMADADVTADKVVMDAAAETADAPDTAPDVAWNQPRRIDSPEAADQLVEEQMAQTAPPVAADMATAEAVADVNAPPAPSAPPAADVAAAQASAAAAAAPKIPVIAPENYTQDPDAPYSPAAARAAAAAQTGTPAEAPTSDMSAADAAPASPAPMALTRPEGPMPLDPAVLQSKDPAAIKSLQKTLADAGFYKGAMNGEMNSDTLNAYVKYQTAANVSAAPQAPVAEAAPAEEAPAQAAPTPVFDQAAPAEQTAPAPAPTMSDAPPAMEEAPAAAAPASPRPLMVSRRTPQPLPPVAPIHMKDESAVPAAAPAPAVQAAPATPTFMPATVSPTDPAVISAAQQALSAKGLYTGPVNGTMDADTLNAVVRYQASNGLTPGVLNIDTLKSLGVVAP